MKQYSDSHGYIPKNLLHYGIDHLKAARFLFHTNDSSYIDSAGYLFHLGIELMLKSLLLHHSGSFPNSHDLLELAKLLQVEGFASFSSTVTAELTRLSSYSGLRYPSPKECVEIGSEEARSIEDLSLELVRIMPDDLKRIAFDLDENIQITKGGRKLWRKPIEA